MDKQTVDGEYTFLDGGRYRVHMEKHQTGGVIHEIAPVERDFETTEFVVEGCDFFGGNSDGSPILSWGENGPRVRLIGMLVFSPEELDRRIQQELAKRLLRADSEWATIGERTSPPAA